MTDGEISIERNLDDIKRGIKEIGNASREIDKDLKAVNAGLKFDPASTELLAQKQELLSKKLKNSQERSQELSAAIAELNRLKEVNGQLTDGQSKQLEIYQQELKKTSAEVTGLSSNVEKQIEVNKASTISFSKSMTEFQSHLRAVNQSIGGVSSAFKLMGGDSNSAIGQAIKQGQEATRMFQGLLSMNKLMEQSNNKLAQSFGALAMVSGGAVLGASIGNLIAGWKELSPAQKVAQISTIALTGAMTALAIAKAAASLPFPANLAAIAATAAALGTTIVASVASAKKAAGGDGGDSSTSMPSASTPSVPNYSSSSGTQGGNSYTTAPTTINITMNASGNLNYDLDTLGRELSKRMANQYLSKR